MAHVITHCGWKITGRECDALYVYIIYFVYNLYNAAKRFSLVPLRTRGHFVLVSEPRVVFSFSIYKIIYKFNNVRHHAAARIYYGTVRRGKHARSRTECFSRPYEHLRRAGGISFVSAFLKVCLVSVTAVHIIGVEDEPSRAEGRRGSRNSFCTARRRRRSNCK